MSGEKPTMDPKWLVEGQANEEACTCRACKMLMEQPTSGCSQGHCLCKPCYLTIIEGATPVCPVCNEKTNGGKLQRIRPFESVIGNLLLARCKHGEGGGCPWRGAVSELAAHLASSCPLEPISCPDCEERLARQDMKEHAEGTCSFFRCRHCHVMIQTPRPLDLSLCLPASLSRSLAVSHAVLGAADEPLRLTPRTPNPTHHAPNSTPQTPPPNPKPEAGTALQRTR